MGQARLADAFSDVALSASYLEDALGVLLEAVGTLLEGAERAGSWEEEPGGYRWIFDRAGLAVRLRVLAFRDVLSSEPDEVGVTVFETSQPLTEMATAIADGAQAVLDELGEDEYLRRWVDFPFPTGHLRMIRDQLTKG